VRAIADGVWVDTAPVRFLGLHLTANMVVERIVPAHGEPIVHGAEQQLRDANRGF
jgi:hypothetical protein